jgi:hypothetical protein
MNLSSASQGTQEACGEESGKAFQWEWLHLSPPGGISLSFVAHVRLACLEL